MGRGRTTTGMIIATMLLLRRQSFPLTLHDSPQSERPLLQCMPWAVPAKFSQTAAACELIEPEKLLKRIHYAWSLSFSKPLLAASCLLQTAAPGKAPFPGQTAICAAMHPIVSIPAAHHVRDGYSG